MVRLNRGIKRGGQHHGERGAEDRGAAEQQERPEGQERPAFAAGAGEVPREDGGHHGGDHRGDGPGLAAEQLQAHGPPGDRQQQHRQEPDEPLAGAVPDLAVGLQGQEGQAVQEGESDDGEPAEDGVGAEPGERAALPVTVGVQRQSRGGQGQCGADAEGGDERTGRDGPVPAGTPRGVSTLPRYSKATARKMRATRTSSSGRYSAENSEAYQSGKAANVAPPRSGARPRCRPRPGRSCSAGRGVRCCSGRTPSSACRRRGRSPRERDSPSTAPRWR